MSLAFAAETFSKDYVRRVDPRTIFAGLVIIFIWQRRALLIFNLLFNSILFNEIGKKENTHFTFSARDFKSISLIIITLLLSFLIRLFALASIIILCFDQDDESLNQLLAVYFFSPAKMEVWNFGNPFRASCICSAWLAWWAREHGHLMWTQWCHNNCRILLAAFLTKSELSITLFLAQVAHKM